jgi:hypothetical protein
VGSTGLRPVQESRRMFHQNRWPHFKVCFLGIILDLLIASIFRWHPLAPYNNSSIQSNYSLHCMWFPSKWTDLWDTFGICRPCTFA